MHTVYHSTIFIIVYVHVRTYTCMYSVFSGLIIQQDLWNLTCTYMYMYMYIRAVRCCGYDPKAYSHYRHNVRQSEYNVSNVRPFTHTLIG